MPIFDVANFFTYPPGSTFGPYTPRTHELVWIEEGGARVSRGDDASVVLRPGSVLLTPRGTPTRFAWDPEASSRHGIVWFRSGDVSPLAVDLPAGDVVPSLLRHLVHLDATRPHHWSRDAQQALLTALQALVVPRAVAAGPVLSGPVLTSLGVVRERWGSHGPWSAVPLDDLASAAAVTPAHLCRVWTAEVGMSPVAALRVVRLYRAAYLLARGSSSVHTVAMWAGFESPFHFSRAFKNAFGASPRNFREKRQLPPEVGAGLRAVMAHL